MAARRPSIDLLSREGVAHHALGRFLLWVLTVGRYVVIFTELVVIAGFITRVVLDHNLQTVNENLLEQKAILASYQPVEQQLTNVHQKLDAYSEIAANRLAVSKLLTDVSKITPVDMRVDSLAIDEKSLNLNAISLSPGGFATFLALLQTNPAFVDLILNSVETGGPRDPSLRFSISLELKGNVIPTRSQSAPTTVTDTEFQ